MEPTTMQQPTQAKETTYGIHFKNDTDGQITVKVKDKEGTVLHKTSMEAGGTGNPYQPKHQAWKYRVQVFIPARPHTYVADYYPVTLNTGSQLATVQETNNDFSIQLSDFS